MIPCNCNEEESWNCNPAAPFRAVTKDNMKEDPYTGTIIVRLKQDYAYREGNDLKEFAKKQNLLLLLGLLEEYKNIKARRLIKSVDIKRLAEMEGRSRRSRFPLLNSLSIYWKLDCRAIWNKADELMALLNQAPEVDLAYKEMTSTDPVNASDDTYAASQHHLDAAPTGINARWAWTQVNGDGTGVGYVDLEQGWILNHEDLIGKAPALIFNDNRNGIGGYVGDHGTAVMGEVYANDNTIGVIGAAPNISYVKATSHYDAATDTSGHVADAIIAALAIMNPGDVLLLEIQKGATLLPTESDPADLDAIRLAIAHGIIVVEAGGNGGNNLDTWTDAGGKFRLNRTHADFIDSGAILVGACLSALPHNRASFSNYGSRVDCYGWGENVVTCGYGDLAGTMSTNDYTQTFSGTSSASPIVTGAALLTQSIYKSANSGAVLSPTQMRALLSNPATGTPQGGGVAGNIGVMPNLQAIVQNTLGLVPDVYLRDFVGDDGSVPSAGLISASPDIIVRPDAVADPTAAFGEGSGTENSDTQGYQVEKGQNNFIYVRMKNRGAANANGTTATIYWSEVSTLVTPDMWHLIGTSAPVIVPAGNTLVVTDAIVWDKAGIPATGHYCFVGFLNQAQDPAPPLPGVIDWNGFYALIRDQNNVTWRNFNVVDVLPDPSDPSVYELPFLIAGAPDDARAFDLEVIKAFPEGVKIWLEVPLALHGFLVANNEAIYRDEQGADAGKELVRLPLNNLSRLQFCQTHLPKSARYACKFHVSHTDTLSRGTHYLAIRQIHEGLEVGRVTWAFKPVSKK